MAFYRLTWPAGRPNSIRQGFVKMLAAQSLGVRLNIRTIRDKRVRHLGHDNEEDVSLPQLGQISKLVSIVHHSHI